MNDRDERVIPPFLAKRGIRSVADNLDGREIVLPPGTISLFFGKEILRALEARRLARLPPTLECPTK